MIEENKGCNNEDKANSEVANARTTSASSAGICDDIVCDILTRLPVKSLIRFKSVCKHWTSLIRSDSFLIDLQSRRSRERSSNVNTLIFFTRRMLPGTKTTFSKLIGFDFNTVNISTVSKHQHNELPVVVASLHRYQTPDFWNMARPVNGLICLYQYHKGIIRVANIATGEETPWIKATLIDETDRLDYYKIKHYVCKWRTGFGFDPTTKKHKVICMYQKSRVLCDYDEYDLLREKDEVDEVCEVMTLEHNNNYTWRRIDDYPQYQIDGHLEECVYSKGSIYWISKGYICTARWKEKNPSYKTPSEPYCEGMALIAFDVGSEKFRTIAMPRHTEFSPKSRDPITRWSNLKLLEVSGHIALVDCHDASMWLFMDDHSHGSEETSSSGKWIKETILINLPFGDYLYSFEDAVPGTDEIILRVMVYRRTSDRNEKLINQFFVCYYNWRNKTVRNLTEISTGENGVEKLRKVIIFVESLMPV